MNDDRMDEIIRDAARDYNRPPAAGAPREEIWARVKAARQAPRASQAPTSAPHREWIWRGVGIAAVLVIGIAIGRFVERKNAGTDSAPPSRQIASNSAGNSTHDSLAPVAPSPTVEAAAPESSRSTSESFPGRTTQLATAPAAPRNRSTATPDRVAIIDRDGPSNPSMSDNANGLALRLALVKHLAGTEAMLTSFRNSAKSGDVDAQLVAWAKDLLRTTRLLQTSAASEHDLTLRRLLDDLELVLLQISQYTSKSTDHAQELELIERSIEKRGVIAKLRTTTPAFPAGT